MILRLGILLNHTLWKKSQDNEKVIILWMIEEKKDWKRKFQELLEWRFWQKKNEKIRNLVTIHKVELTKDGRYLDLTFSILDLNDNVNKEKIAEDLNKLKGFFRKKIGSQLTVRFVPEVRIHLDDSVEYGVKIASILSEIKKENSDTE